MNSFFAVAVFLGLAFSPPIPLLQVVTSLAPQRADCFVNVDVYRGVILYEVLSFGCFLFSTLLAHGFKLFIVLGMFTSGLFCMLIWTSTYSSIAGGRLMVSLFHPIIIM